MASTEQRGETPRADCIDGTMLASAAAPLDCCGVGAGFWGGPKTQHVLLTSVPCAQRCWFPRCSSWRSARTEWWWSIVTLGSLRHHSLYPSIFFNFSFPLSYWLNYVDILNWRASPPQQACCLRACTAGTQLCSSLRAALNAQDTTHRAQCTSKPLLDTHGLVKPQSVRKDSQGKMRQPLRATQREGHEQESSCKFTFLAGILPMSWQKKYFKLSCWWTVPSLVVDYRKSGSMTWLHTICHAEFADEQISDRYPPASASVSFKICPDTQKLFWTRKGFTIINTTSTAIPISGALILSWVFIFPSF